MRSRPQTMVDLLTAALRSVSMKHEEDGTSAQFEQTLIDQGAFEVYAEADGALQARLDGEPCPACNDLGDDCPVCGFTAAQLPPPGWYADPEHDGYRRYWTGQRWDDNPVEILPGDDTELGDL